MYLYGVWSEYRISKPMSESKQETKEETKETRETRSEDELNREAYADIIKYLMTNPETGEEWSYAESRMRYG